MHLFGLLHSAGSRYVFFCFHSTDWTVWFRKKREHPCVDWFTGNRSFTAVQTDVSLGCFTASRPVYHCAIKTGSGVVFPRSRSTGNGEKNGITVETAKGKRDLVFFWDMRHFKTAPLSSRSVIKLLLQPGVLLFTPFRSTAIRVSRLLAPAALLMLCL